VQAGEATGERQAHADAFEAAVEIGLDLGEGLHHPLEMLWRDADAVILDHDLDTALGADRGREAHATARRAFDLAEEEFEPHLSLAYAIPLEHEASELLRRVPGRPWGRFMVDSLTLVRTAGAPEEWEVLGRLPLRGVEAQ